MNLYAKPVESEYAGNRKYRVRVEGYDPIKAGKFDEWFVSNDGRLEGDLINPRSNRCASVHAMTAIRAAILSELQ